MMTWQNLRESRADSVIGDIWVARINDEKKKMLCEINKALFLAFKKKKCRSGVKPGPLFQALLENMSCFQRLDDHTRQHGALEKRLNGNNDHQSPCWLPSFPTFDKCCSAPPPSYFSILLASLPSDWNMRQERWYWVFSPSQTGILAAQWDSLKPKYSDRSPLFGNKTSYCLIVVPKTRPLP